MKAKGAAAALAVVVVLGGFGGTGAATLKPREAPVWLKVAEGRR